MTKYTLQQVVEEAIKINQEFLVIKTYDEIYFRESRASDYIDYCLDMYTYCFNKYIIDEKFKKRLKYFKDKEELDEIEFKELGKVYKYLDEREIPRDTPIYPDKQLKYIAKRNSIIYTIRAMVEEYNKLLGAEEKDEQE